MSDDIIIEVLSPVAESWSIPYEAQQGFVNHALLKIIASDMLFPVGREYDVLVGRR